MKHYTGITNGLTRTEIVEILQDNFDYEFANITTIDKDSILVILPDAIDALENKFLEMEEIIERLNEDIMDLQYSLDESGGE